MSGHSKWHTIKHKKAATDAIVQVTRFTQPASGGSGEHRPERVADDDYRHENRCEEQ